MVAECIQREFEQGFEGNVAEVVRVVDPPEPPLLFEFGGGEGESAALLVTAREQNPAHFFGLRVASQKTCDVQDQQDAVAACAGLRVGRIDGLSKMS